MVNGCKVVLGRLTVDSGSEVARLRTAAFPVRVFVDDNQVQ